ncbi:MAG: UDP-N-acetylglucosamine 2-epimerase [Tepidisphaeraceae bacterium]
MADTRCAYSVRRQANQSPSALTARLLQSLDTTIQQVKPDWVLAQGDTTTVLAASPETGAGKVSS